MTYRLHIMILLVVTASATTAGAVTELRPSDLEPGSGFGAPVAASIQDIAVAAPFAGDKSGAVFVYRASPDGEAVELTRRLDPPSKTKGGLFGRGLSVGLSDAGSLVVVGEPGASGSAPGSTDKISGAGAVHLWRVDDEGDVEFLQSLHAPSADVRKMGSAVAACGQHLFVTANKGVAVFTAADDEFRFRRWLDVPRSKDVGASVSCSMRGLVAVGAPQHREKDSRGAVFLFTLRDGDWVPHQTILAPNFGEFGLAVALDILHNVMVVGAYQEDRPLDVYPDYQNALGAAYIYESDDPEAADGRWKLVDRVHGPNTQHDDHFGVSVGALGRNVFVGAFGQAPDPGATGMFHTWTRGADRWLHGAAVRPGGQTPYEAFGISTAVGNGYVVVGATFSVEPNKRGTAFMLTAKEALNGVVGDPKQVAGVAVDSAGEPGSTATNAGRSVRAAADAAARHQKRREAQKKADRLTKAMGKLGGSYDTWDICLAIGFLLLLVGIAAYRRTLR